MKPIKFLLDRFGRKSDTRHLRVRLESCVETVLLLGREVGEEKMGREVVAQFERLRETLPHIDDGSVNEQDICRIEQITNNVLDGMRHVLSKKAVTTIYEGKAH